MSSSPLPNYSCSFPLPRTAEALVDALHLIPHPEGGYFRETFRSGSVPMTTMGFTDLKAVDSNLVIRMDQLDQYAKDGPTEGSTSDPRRNCLTSIYWVPTIQAPILKLAINGLDHVHYYQGGRPFQYFLYHVAKRRYESIILGPDLSSGQQLQVAVNAGTWKCGRMLMKEGEHDPYHHAEYTIIAEAVGPGFDFSEFRFVSSGELELEDGLSDDEKITLRLFLSEPGEQNKSAYDEFYEGNKP